MVFMLDRRKPLGAQVWARYEHVLSHAQVVFHYRAGQIVSNDWPKVTLSIEGTSPNPSHQISAA
jgi:hypothetical protein